MTTYHYLILIRLQVRERCPSLVRECHVLLPLLEEMEKYITTFYQALERASRITSTVRDQDTLMQAQQKQKWQVSYNNNEWSELEWLPEQCLVTNSYVLSVLSPLVLLF